MTPEEALEEGETKQPKTVAAAVWQVALADLSLSLDNVLTVAGAAKNHLEIRVVGLIISIVMMAFAANFIAIKNWISSNSDTRHHTCTLLTSNGARSSGRARPQPAGASPESHTQQSSGAHADHSGVRRLTGFRVSATAPRRG